MEKNKSNISYFLLLSVYNQLSNLYPALLIYSFFHCCHSFSSIGLLTLTSQIAFSATILLNSGINFPTHYASPIQLTHVFFTEIINFRSYGSDMTYVNLIFPIGWLIHGIVCLTALFLLIGLPLTHLA